MEKLRLSQVLLVEGKYDAAKLSELVDGLILTTGGFSIFTDTEKQQLIKDLGRRRGLLLPDLEGVDTVEQQVEIARRKGGISAREPYTLERFQVVRHI